MPKVEVVTCKLCNGGENGERTACLSSIRTIVENGNIAFMQYVEHVHEKIVVLGYKTKYCYADNDKIHPIGMWITQGDFR